MQSNLSLRHIIANNHFVLRNITKCSLPWWVWTWISQVLCSPGSIIPISFSLLFTNTIFAHIPIFVHLECSCWECYPVHYFLLSSSPSMMSLVFGFRAFQEKSVVIFQPFLGILSVAVSSYIEASTFVFFFPWHSFLNFPLSICLLIYCLHITW